MIYAYRQFDNYEDFESFLNKKAANTGWKLDSWQDIGGGNGVDIRAIFSTFRSSTFPWGSLSA